MGRHTWHWLRRTQNPQALRRLLLVGSLLIALLLGGLNVWIDYRRLSEQTLHQTEQQSATIARMVAAMSEPSMLGGSSAALQDELERLGVWPELLATKVLRHDGSVLAETTHGQREPDPHNHYSYVLKVQPRLAPQPIGWVQVDYSLRPQAEEMRRLWIGSLQSLGVTLLLIVVALPWLIGRVLRQAHNKASRDVAAQVARTQVIVNTAAMAIISLDRQGCVTSANPATTSIFGRDEAELMGLSLTDCIPGLDGERLQTLFGDLQGVAGHVHRVVRQDFEGTRRDGTRFPIEISLGQAPSDDAVHYVCIVRDVTDERAARETSELYERALASSHNGVFITDATMAAQPVVFINEAFQRITGLAPHQILGQGVQALRNRRGDDSAFSEFRMAISEARRTNVTLRHVLENGRLIMAEVSLSPIRSADGRLTNFVGIMSDVSDRIRAEQAIAERSARLDSIFSLSPDGFVLFDADERLMFANPAFERMTGTRWLSSGVTMLRGEFEQVLARLCPSDFALPPLQASDAALDGDWTARVVLSRPTHRVLQVQSRRNLAGQGESILYFRDVTHQDEVDRMKSEFLASAAHELRTPMVSIFGFTELLLKRDFSADRRNDMLQTIHRQSGLLVKMINELLDLARIESRRGLDMHIAEHPLQELIGQSVRGLMRQEGERQVKLEAVPEVQVLVDLEKMQLALINLMSNAFKYSPAGGDVVVSARLDERNHHRFAVLEVRDQGMGMTPEQLQRAFERFYRADTTGNIPGTGLGLSLVKEVADLHGGAIELESTRNVGTLARLWIPLATSRTDVQDVSCTVALQA